MGNADHLGVSIDFALDFWNILTRVAQILGIYSKDDWNQIIDWLTQYVS